MTACFSGGKSASGKWVENLDLCFPEESRVENHDLCFPEESRVENHNLCLPEESRVENYDICFPEENRVENHGLRRLVVLRLNVPVNNFSVMSGRSHRFLGN